MLYIIYNEDREDGAAAIRAAQRESHFAYLHSHEKTLILAGATAAGLASLSPSWQCREMVGGGPELGFPRTEERNEIYHRAGALRSQI